MSNILIKWVQDVGLENITNLEKDFSSGYKLGQLLTKLNIKDFGREYINSSETDAIIVNYSQLERTLSKLGIKLSIPTTLSLIQEKPGAAARLLYEIKSSISIMEKNTETSTFPLGLNDSMLKNSNFPNVLKARLGSLKMRELPPLPIRQQKKAVVPQKPVKSAKKPDLDSATAPQSPKKQAQILEAVEDITEFENRVSRESIESSIENLLNDSIKTEEIVDYMNTRNSMNPSQHMDHLTKKIPETDSSGYMKKIRVNKLEEDLARKEREHRCRKAILQNDINRREQEKKKMDELIHSKLQRQSKQERRIAEQLMQVRHQKQVIIENRIFRDEQYKKQRQKEYEEAIDREYHLYETLRQDFLNNTKDQQEKHAQLLKQKMDKKHEANELYVRKIVEELINFSFRIADYRQLDDSKPIPIKKMREWKALFQNCVAIQSQDTIPLQQDQIPKITAEESTVTEAVECLDVNEFTDYVFNQGNWTGNIPANPLLGQILETLNELTAEPEKVLEIQTIPKVPLKLSIIGKKFSGKKTIASRLSKRFGVNVIKVTDLIKEAIREADINKKDGKGRLGAQIQLALVQGQSPDDALLVELVVQSLNLNSDYPGGWILVDFPKTREQAVLLEKELSGYEDPKPVKRGEMKRNTKEKQKNKSLIAPSDNNNDASTSSPISGLDAVFLLDIPNTVAFARAAGRVVDAVSHTEYHIESNPPPKTPGTYDRISFIDGQPEGTEQLQYFLSVFEDEEESLKDWFSRFKNLTVIDGTKDSDSDFNDVVNIITQIMDREQKEALELKPVEEGTEKPAGETIAVEQIPGHIKREQNKPSREIAEILLDQWTTIEGSYTDILKFTFRSLRREHNNFLNYFYQTRQNFATFLARPDKCQKLIDTFQQEYNQIEEDLRYDIDLKAELHQRCEDLREKLWELSDKRREEAEQERLSIIEDKWIEDRSIILANIFLSMMQAEIDRFQSTRQLICDYHRDASKVNLPDPAKPGLKINLLSPQSSPPVDVSTLLLNAHTSAVQKQQALKAKANNTNPAPAVKETKKGQPVKVEPQIVKHVLPMTIEKDPIMVDYENVNFTDIQNSIDYILNSLQALDQGIDVKKDEKTDLQKALETEEKILRSRLDRIKQRAVENLKELRAKAYQVYISLDEWICQRFAAEMIAAKDLVTVVKEAIEAEQKLPNRFCLEGEKFYIDFSQLVYEPEPEPRPHSPVQKQMSDQFTILQITNIALELKKFAPTGMISNKNFVDFLVKMSNMSLSEDLVSDNYMNADQAQFQQLCYYLDPFETGYINWRSFLIMHCKILPIQITELVSLSKNITQEISRDEFVKLNFWFDEPCVKGTFDKSLKMKHALFEIFSIEEKFDRDAFIFSCCLDEVSCTGIEKAFAVYDGIVDIEKLYSILHHGMLLTEFSNRFPTRKDDPYPMDLIKKVFDECQSETIDFQTFTATCEKVAPILLQSPAFLITDVNLTSQSRPSSGQEKA